MQNEGAPAKFTAIVLALNLAAVCVIGYVGIRIFHRPLSFDDAFMFQRYAVHWSEGMGVSWNPDGLHTGGLTSMGWFLAILPLGYLPLDQGHPLAAESYVVGLAGIAWLALRVSQLSITSFLRRFWLIFPLLTLFLFGFEVFRYNMVTGMDTMLSFAVNAAFSCSLWAWCDARSGSFKRPALVGALGVCTMVVRPENGMLAVLAPLLACLLLLDRRRRKETLVAATTAAAIIVLYLAWYHNYFHTWVPLSFYLKSQHPYLGYIGAVLELPEIHLRNFLLVAIPVLIFPAICANARGLRIAATFLFPVILTFVYLETVTQIMGGNARYYVPFIAPVLVAAFWMTDFALQGDWRRLLLQRRLKAGLAGLLLALAGAVSWHSIKAWSQRRLTVAAYPAPALVTPSGSLLAEQPWFSTISLLAEEVIKPLPTGSIVAASEVGLIGAAAPHVGIIDLAGLNDTETALHGFSMERLMRSKPVLIWFPHTDYTWQRRVMFCSPNLLSSYLVIGGNAFNYSLAVRRDAPDSQQVLRRVGLAFQKLYPGQAMSGYIVSSIDCAQ